MDNILHGALPDDMKTAVQPEEDVRLQDEEKILLITPEMFFDLLMEQQEQM